MNKAWMLGAAVLFALQASAQTNVYTVTNIIDSSQDPYLFNPWGLSRPTSATLKENEWWISDNSTGFSTLYYANKTGPASLAALVITVPPAFSPGIGSPTGTAYYDSGTRRGSGSSNFAFATLDGTISVWNADTKPAVAGDGCAACHVTSATIRVNHAATGASYQGLTAAKNAASGKQAYFAANANGGIEAYDAASFVPLALPSGAFVDTQVPNTYSPAGVEAVGNKIYVAYNAVVGGGTGYVNQFDTNGKLLLRLQQGWFNQPWGIAVAPSNFGAFSNMLLVGNTGSGWIGAYSPRTGKFVDFLRDASGQPVMIPGLWGLSFGNGSTDSGPTNVLYFAAGGPTLSTGVFGSIAAN